MASFISSAQSFASGVTCDASAPSLSDGDLLIAWHGSLTGEDDEFSTPDGWAYLDEADGGFGGAAVRGALYYRRGLASDTSYTFSGSQSRTRYVVIYNVGDYVIDSYDVHFETAALATAPVINAGFDDSLLLVFAANNQTYGNWSDGTTTYAPGNFGTGWDSVDAGSIGDYEIDSTSSYHVSGSIILSSEILGAIGGFEIGGGDVYGQRINGEDWAGYFTISSNPALIDEAIGDVGYDLSNAPSEFWGLVDTSGSDIRVTHADGAIAYSFELVAFDKDNETGWIFFNAVDLSTSSSVDYRIYAGNDEATLPDNTDFLGRNNVWEDNTVAIYHLEQDPSGSAPQIVDSTGVNDGTTSGTMTDTDLVEGQVESGLDFDGGDDYIDLSDDSSLDFTTEFTFMGWLSYEDLDVKVTLFGRDNAFASFRYTSFRVETDQKLDFIAQDGTSTIVDFAGSTSLSSDTLYHVAISFDSSGTSRIILNGVQDGSASPTGPIVLDTDATNWSIGRLPSVGQYMHGILDECRIDNVARSVNWVKTHYNNQGNNASFWSTDEFVYHVLDVTGGFEIGGSDVWIDNTQYGSGGFELGGSDVWIDNTLYATGRFEIGGSDVWIDNTLYATGRFEIGGSDVWIDNTHYGTGGFEIGGADVTPDPNVYAFGGFEIGGSDVWIDNTLYATGRFEIGGSDVWVDNTLYGTGGFEIGGSSSSPLVGDGGIIFLPNVYDNGYQYRVLISLKRWKDIWRARVPVFITLPTGLADGSDIRFETLAGDLVYHAFYSYNPTDGQLIAFVKTDLSATHKTNLYVYWGSQ